ncbi:MAG: hypothetical protein QE279_03845 [Rhodoferax sp.]|nr:hypothetical protein [Rhodoferax sp.]
MFNQIFYGLRIAATLCATAATLVACGGGEDLALNPGSEKQQSGCTASSDCAVSVNTATAFQYGTGATGGAIATNANDYTVTGTRTDTTEAWGAVVGQLKLAAAQDVSNYKSLKLSLASSSNSEVTLMLVSSGATKDCFPSYKATGLSATAKSVTIALSDFKLANNPDPDKCAPGKTTDPDTADALKSLTEIQVREIKGTAGKNAVNVVVGKPMLWSNDLPSTGSTGDGAACNSTSGGNVPICTTTAFQYGTGASAGALASNGGNYTLTGTRTAATEAWGAVVAQLKLDAAQDVSNYKSLKVSLASSSNTDVTLMLVSSTAKQDCYPTYKATGLSTALKSFTIPLTDFKLANNPDPAKCAPAITTDPDTAVALKSVTEIQVREIKGEAGKNQVYVAVIKPLLWSMELPVVPPTLTAVVVDYTYPVGFGGTGDTTGSATFTTGGTAPWTLNGNRVANAETYSTAIGVLHVNAQPTGTLAKNSLGFTLTSGGNTELLIRLKASNYVDQACTPTFKATGLSTTAKAFTVALSDFKSSNDITASCGTQTATALDLTNFDKIEITDRKETTGTLNINATLSTLNWVLAP